MTRNIYRRAIYTAVALAMAFPLTIRAQQPAQARMVGVVSSIDAASKQIAIKTDAGAQVTVTMESRVSFRRVSPGVTDLRKAETIAFTDIAAGDRLLAVGKASGDQKAIAATLIVDMSKGAIAGKQQAERQDWEKRGVIGVVTSTSADGIAIGVQGPGGRKTLTIAPAPNAVIRRYSPDSIKFSDAKPSTLAEIKVGDQVRARGDKSEDGLKMTAEEIVSGAFREIAATILSIDPAAKQMRVNDLATKKPVVVTIDPDSSLKKLPPQMAQMLAAQNRPPGQNARGGDAPPEGRGGFGRGRGGFGRGARNAGDLTQMLARVPAVTLADLKKGDAIIVLSTVGATPDQLNAITLLAGVEPILTKPGTREMSLGSWSLGGGIGGGDDAGGGSN